MNKSTSFLNSGFKLDYIILLRPTYIHNDTYRGFAIKDGGFLVLSPPQDRIDDYLKLVSYVFEETNSLIILDDFAAFKRCKTGM